MCFQDTALAISQYPHHAGIPAFRQSQSSPKCRLASTLDPVSVPKRTPFLDAPSSAYLAGREDRKKAENATRTIVQVVMKRRQSPPVNPSIVTSTSRPSAISNGGDASARSSRCHFGARNALVETTHPRRSIIETRTTPSTTCARKAKRTTPPSPTKIKPPTANPAESNAEPSRTSGSPSPYG